MLSIIVPLYNEAEQASILMRHLLQLGCADEIIFVDASNDSLSIAFIDNMVEQFFEFRDVHILRSDTAGRAIQMNMGAKKATGDVLLFLHADTRLPEGVDRLVKNNLDDDCIWGRFKVGLDVDAPIFRLIADMINLRSKWFDLATGDQALFVARNVFNEIGGYKEIQLMEDVEISRRLKKISKPALVDAYVVTSARRWQKYGVVKTIFLMWSLRLLYWCKVPVSWLARLYRYES